VLIMMTGFSLHTMGKLELKSCGDSAEDTGTRAAAGR